MSVMLYRPADEPNPAAWNLPLEHAVFEDDAVDAALAEGWVRHPDDIGAEKPDAPQAAPKRKGRPPKEA
jgi:hypothetical protein